MFVIEKKEKPKQGRIQRGFVKGGVGGGDDTSPLPNETFSWNCFFLSKRGVALKLSNDCPITLPVPGLVQFGWVFEKFTSADLSQIARKKIMWLPIITALYWG